MRKETFKKQIQTELATLIYESAHQGRFSSAGMLCRLELLEAGAARRDWPLFDCLRRWMAAESDSEQYREISEIIKATLINVDFQDAGSVQTNTEIICSLVKELE